MLNYLCILLKLIYSKIVEPEHLNTQTREYLYLIAMIFRNRTTSFRELLVYQKAKVLCQEIFQLTKRFPMEEAYSLTDQVRRSSRSIGSQIAEAWAKRLYEMHFISKLTDADGEQNETQHWIDTATDCNYLNDVDAAALIQQCEEIGRMLSGMISKAEQFCFNLPTVVREEIAEYFVRGCH